MSVVERTYACPECLQETPSLCDSCRGVSPLATIPDVAAPRTADFHPDDRVSDGVEEQPVAWRYIVVDSVTGRERPALSFDQPPKSAYIKNVRPIPASQPAASLQREADSGLVEELKKAGEQVVKDWDTPHMVNHRSDGMEGLRAALNRLSAAGESQGESDD